jgi:3'(2'), 5'-bisphosphate nucleotidase
MDETSLEFITAFHAVRAASVLCQKVGNELAGNEALLKEDRSPVTVADYGSQAVICRLIREKFPDDAIVAEEDSSELKKPINARTLERVTGYVGSFIPGATQEEVCSWIDFSSQTLRGRFWTLDPIDGTKGFLRGEQYAVALALVEKGSVQMGILACPNLHRFGESLQEEKGCLFFAQRGKGAFQMDMRGGSKRTLSVSKVADPSEAVFTESVESDHADHLIHQRLAKKLSVTNPPLRVDSQAKYGIVARGEAALYLRVPSPSEPGYREKIWDHAAGSIIAEEAGGRVTDVRGRPLDFSHGITMEDNYGILVTNGLLHDIVLETLEKLE